MSGPIETGNIVLIGVGICLIASCPIIIYRTIRGMVQARRKDPKANIHPISNGLNLIIGVVFGAAGVLFIINNLAGNPLAKYTVP